MDTPDAGYRGGRPPLPPACSSHCRRPPAPCAGFLFSKRRYAERLGYPPHRRTRQAAFDRTAVSRDARALNAKYQSPAVARYRRSMTNIRPQLSFVCRRGRACLPTADIRDAEERSLGHAVSAFTSSARTGDPRLGAQCLNGAGGWRTMIFRGCPGLSHSAITVIRRRSDHARSARVLISVPRLK
ncbi:hypothetical protein OKW26_002857 [Paraburkholderia sp. 32]